MKHCIPIFLALLLLVGCAAGGQASDSDSKPESGPSSVSQPALGPASSPEKSPQPSQSEEASDEVRNPTSQRYERLFSRVQDSLLSELPETSYSYLSLYDDGPEIVLRIGVTDEAAVDACLAAWTGERWDRLVKEPALYSRAKRAEFVEKANALDFGPEVNVLIGSFPPFWNDEKVVIAMMVVMADHYAPREEVEKWQEMPQEIKNLARETGIPEDLIDYSGPVYYAPEIKPDT